MNKHPVLLIIGGDFRQLEVINILAPKLGTIYLVGFENISISFDNIKKVSIENVPFSILDFILLPVPGIQDDGVVESKFSDEPIIFTKEILNQTNEKCILYTGVITSYLKQLTEEWHREIVALFARNEVAISNSIPTAEGTLMLAIQHTNITIHQSHVIVSGFGRVGMTVARLFSNVGAYVRVYARKAEDIARIAEMNMTPISSSNLVQSLNESDIIINTVPSLILTASLIKEMPAHALIIDLASKPGGTDFQAAKLHNIKTLWPLGLPAKVAPKTAGKIIANTLLQLIN